MSVAFQARALVEPRLAESLLRGYTGVQALLEDVVRRGAANGAAAEGTDPETAATAVLAPVDGLRAQTLLGHGTRERALAVLDDHLDRLFPG
ncbi:TetR family transcriptional regulator C-terminal domain-containing protein [Nocardiopsis deserti]|uniref:TetR family transcriptional regulator C-terminal domain-containing protein n=1 Tax=Nocardiopsis deserti TaxID=2605988 RepID=UPI00168160F0|nr:TetR family transcriptional regulator C-terminal domain-containing protein [Nocardiopsis deserti]